MTLIGSPRSNHPLKLRIKRIVIICLYEASEGRSLRLSPTTWSAEPLSQTTRTD